MHVSPGEQYCGLHFWNWVEIDNDEISRCVWAFAKKNNCLVEQVWENEESLRRSDVNRAKECALFFGDFYQAYFLFRACEINNDILFGKYNLLIDGETPFDEARFLEIYSEVNVLFQNCIVSGKRFIERVEHLILKRFGSSSTQFQKWKDTTSYVYDNDLAYSFCYNARNCIEHEFPLINIVNVDTGNHVAGVAINLENDYMNMQHTSTHKRQLNHFVQKQRKQGLSPWLSVGGTLTKYYTHIKCLYYVYLFSLSDAIDQKMDAVELFCVNRNVNCLVRHSLDSSGGGPKKPLHRLYWIPSRLDLKKIKTEAQRIDLLLNKTMQNTC